jgi:succinate dehydrogenase / fumarate reductase, membrane anchor subunit
MTGFRTPLGRVRGLGSAKHGVGHFITQRVSAVALVVLVLWAIGVSLGLARADYATISVWLRAPWNAAPAVLLIGVAFLHMNIGMRVIIEDYIEAPLTKATLLILSLFVCWIGAVVGILSILKVAFGGGAY